MKTNRPAMVIGAVLAAGVAGWIVLRPAADAPPAPIEPPTRVAALGTLEPEGRLRRLAVPAGPGRTIREITATEGDFFSRGAVLATLDAFDEARAERMRADARVAVAAARLERVLAGLDPNRVRALESELDSARSAAEQASRDLGRTERLEAAGALSRGDAEANRLRHRQAHQEVQRLAAVVREARTVRPEDRAIAAAELAEARAESTLAAERMRNAEVRAPRDGVVLRILAWPGERAPEDGLIEFGDVRRMVAVAEVFEADAAAVRVGQPARVTVKSTDLVLTGTVAETGLLVGRKATLDNDPVADTDARVVQVRVALDAESSAKVRRLSNARVDILIDRQPQ